MKGEFFFNLVAGLFVVIFILLLIMLSGIYYQGLRFLIEGEEKTITISDCSVCYSFPTRGPAYLIYEINSPDISSDIILSSTIKLFSKKDQRQTINNCNQLGGTNSYTPKKDWCKIARNKIDVFFYEKNNLTYLKKGGKIRTIIYNQSDIFDIIIVFIFAVFFSVAIFFSYVCGGMLFYFIFRRLCVEVILQFNSAKKSFFDGINGLLLPLIIILLSSALIITIGLIIGRSLIFFDVENIFLSGIIGMSGLGLTAFGPFIVLKFVNYIRGQNANFILLLQNLTSLYAASHLLIESIKFYSIEFVYTDIENYFLSFIQELIG